MIRERLKSFEDNRNFIFLNPCSTSSCTAKHISYLGKLCCTSAREIIKGAILMGERREARW